MIGDIGIDRRTFVLSLACLPLSTLGAAGAGSFVCPPCGLSCDALAFDRPGTCPNCAMTLIPRADLATPYGTATFPRNASSVRFPFQLLANGIYFEAMVNGKGPHLFALDTGSTNSVIASELIAELGIVTGARFAATGAGSDANAAARIDTLDFVLPEGVTRTTKQGATVSMAGLWPLIGRKFYGVVGYDVVQPFVVEIDYAKRSMALHDPAAYRPTGRGTTFPAKLWAGYDPQIAGEMLVPGRPPIPVRFTLDTGAGGTIVSAPLVDTYHLLDAVGRTAAVRDQGIGGAEPSEVLARISAFRIGPYAVTAPVVALSRDRHGSLASESISVNLGGNILRRFTVVIDYARATVTLEPNDTLHDPFPSDASGLLLQASGAEYRTFVVASVAAASPASEAGLQPGDRITAVDGRATADHALWELQDELKRAGTTIALTIARDGKTFARPLRLRALV